MANNRSGNKKRDRSKSISSVQPRSYSEYLKKTQGADSDVVPAQALRTEKTARATAAVSKGPDTVEWQGEYGHVLKDLRTLIIVSVLLFAAMIAAGFLL